MKSLIPNFFTMANLVCGCLAIYFAFKEPLLETATLFIMAGAFFDLFDGFFARLLKVQGELGKQLDSLADAVTFGVAPGMIVFLLFSRICSLHEWPIWVGFFAFILVIASIYRLGKFNIDTRQSDSFHGLPTPSNALFWIGIVHLYSMGYTVETIDPDFIELGLPYASYTDSVLFTVRNGVAAAVFHPITFIVMVVGMSWWMISDIKMCAEIEPGTS
jgi:CDP-diacylglycerol--serine O-phosphatidyltransferase